MFASRVFTKETRRKHATSFSKRERVLIEEHNEEQSRVSHWKSLKLILKTAGSKTKRYSRKKNNTSEEKKSSHTKQNNTFEGKKSTHTENKGDEISRNNSNLGVDDVPCTTKVSSYIQDFQNILKKDDNSVLKESIHSLEFRSLLKQNADIHFGSIDSYDIDQKHLYINNTSDSTLDRYLPSRDFKFSVSDDHDSSSTKTYNFEHFNYKNRDEPSSDINFRDIDHLETTSNEFVNDCKQDTDKNNAKDNDHTTYDGASHDSTYYDDKNTSRTSSENFSTYSSSSFASRNISPLSYLMAEENNTELNVFVTSMESSNMDKCNNLRSLSSISSDMSKHPGYHRNLNQVLTSLLSLST